MYQPQRRRPAVLARDLRQNTGHRTAAGALGGAGDLAVVEWASSAPLRRSSQLGGFAADPPTVSGSFTDISNDQLVQAMAGFGCGAADDSDEVFLGDDTSQQTLLTTPQHA